ncbi:MAG: hypothetical protein U1B83_00500 [Candidatus Cloacimonadaceae bacterium]|nr:hypothetical protein [Candidatus Cloacimonadaceae bacterium]
MKVLSKLNLTDLTGSTEGLIYYRNSVNGKVYARKRFTFKNHPGQPRFAAAQKAIYAIQPSKEYRQNLSDYLIGYNKLPENEGKQLMSWANLYNKLMFAMQTLMPIELKDISREQIVEHKLPCISVKDAVENGLLPVVKGFEKYNKPI